MRYQRWTETSCLSWVIKTSQRERLMDFLFLDGLVCRWCLTRKWLRLSKENILTFNEWYTRTKKMTPPRPGRCQDLKVGCICFFTTIQISKAKHQRLKRSKISFHLQAGWDSSPPWAKTFVGRATGWGWQLMVTSRSVFSEPQKLTSNRPWGSLQVWPIAQLYFVLHFLPAE